MAAKKKIAAKKISKPAAKSAAKATVKAKPKAKQSITSPLAAAEAALREIGLAFPETTEDFPWGHRALKVKGKAFVFMSSEGGEFSLSVKLPDSCDFALMQPYASPTGYGLAKSGWVTARFGKKDKVPVPLMGAWLRESYLAVAPKKIGSLLRDRQA
jgi:predicted DNA-binding protein (MmcQ/YjbR family)